MSEESPLDLFRLRLDGLVGKCERLVDAGLPYVVVMLSHELVRYLYPHEPVTGFTHDDPVPYLFAHLARLDAIADATLVGVAGYPGAKAAAPVDESASIEMKTSSLYSDLWQSFDRSTMERESIQLLRNRIPDDVLETRVRGRRVLDVGCGSGRYTLALAAIGADATGVDYQPRSFARAAELASANGLSASFLQADVLNLPFDASSFDFVFCNGVLHHTQSMEKGLDEYLRVMRPGGAGFLYLYGDGGMFWHSRRRLRELFKMIPFAYTQSTFAVMGVPPNRFVFCDSWYVPLERHTSREEIEELLRERRAGFRKLDSKNLIDLDCALARGVKDAATVWGDGDNRYLIEKLPA